jgi:hypothetical protein
VSDESKIQINGLVYDAEMFKAFGKLVEQEDYLFESQTPHELFTFAAKLGTSLNDAQREQKV